MGDFFCSTIRLQFVGIFSSNNKNKLTCQQGAKNKSSKLQLLFWNNCSTVSTPTKKTLPLCRYYTAEKWTIFRTKNVAANSFSPIYLIKTDKTVCTVLCLHLTQLSSLKCPKEWVHFLRYCVWLVSKINFWKVLCQKCNLVWRLRGVRANGGGLKLIKLDWSTVSWKCWDVTHFNPAGEAFAMHENLLITLNEKSYMKTTIGMLNSKLESLLR